MFFHSIYLHIKHLPIYEIFRYEIIRYEIIRKIFTKIFVNVIIHRRLSKLNNNIQGNRIKF